MGSVSKEALFTGSGKDSARRRKDTAFGELWFPDPLWSNSVSDEGGGKRTACGGASGERAA